MSRAVLRKRQRQSKVWWSGTLPWSPLWSCRRCPTGRCWSRAQAPSSPSRPCRRRRLVQDCAPGGADVDVFPNPEKLHHHVTMTVPGRQKIFNFTSWHFFYLSLTCSLSAEVCECTASPHMRCTSPPFWGESPTTSSLCPGWECYN